MEKKLITVETFVSEIRDKQNIYEAMVWHGYYLPDIKSHMHREIYDGRVDVSCMVSKVWGYSIVTLPKTALKEDIDRDFIAVVDCKEDATTYW